MLSFMCFHFLLFCLCFLLFFFVMFFSNFYLFLPIWRKNKIKKTTTISYPVVRRSMLRSSNFEWMLAGSIKICLLASASNFWTLLALSKMSVSSRREAYFHMLVIQKNTSLRGYGVHVEF